MSQVAIVPGAFHLPGCVPLETQRALVERCGVLGEAPAGFYRPTVRGGGRMRFDMMCLGLHWNARTYRYGTHRSDHDALPVPPIPEVFAAMAVRIAGEVGMAFEPQVCIVNRYPPEGKLGLHQDKDERRDTLDAGVPIVSISLGDTARFLLGGLRRRDKVRALDLASGDALVMGGPARLRYHGVARLLPGTAPPSLHLQGRYNLTFRQYAFGSEPLP